MRYITSGMSRTITWGSAFKAISGVEAEGGKYWNKDGCWLRNSKRMVEPLASYDKGSEKQVNLGRRMSLIAQNNKTWRKPPLYLSNLTWELRNTKYSLQEGPKYMTRRVLRSPTILQSYNLRFLSSSKGYAALSLCSGLCLLNESISITSLLSSPARWM